MTDIIPVSLMDPRAIKFAENHRRTCTVPKNARGMCHAMSKLFCSLHPEAYMVMLEGFKGDTSQSTWKGTAPERYRHVVVHLDGVYYDFTARQYHPDHNVPRAQVLMELEDEWRHIE